MSDALMTVMFIGLCAAVFVYDVLFRRVPNQLILLGLTMHVAVLLWTGTGMEGVDIARSMLGGAVGLALFVPLYAMKAMGAGDVKYFSLLGFLLGPHYLIPLWLISSLCAGVHAVLVYLSPLYLLAIPGVRQLMDRVAANDMYRCMLQKREGRKGIPYAAYLSLAAVGVCVYQA